jgi:hypothetical protein
LRAFAGPSHVQDEDDTLVDANLDRSDSRGRRSRRYPSEQDHDRENAADRESDEPTQ